MSEPLDANEVLGLPADGKERRAAVWVFEDAFVAEFAELDGVMWDRRADFFGGWRGVECSMIDVGIDVFVRLGNGQMLGLCLTVEEDVTRTEPPLLPRLVLASQDRGESE